VSTSISAGSVATEALCSGAQIAAAIPEGRGRRPSARSGSESTDPIYKTSEKFLSVRKSD